MLASDVGIVRLGMNESYTSYYNVIILSMQCSGSQTVYNKLPPPIVHPAVRELSFVTGETHQVKLQTK